MVRVPDVRTALTGVKITVTVQGLGTNENDSATQLLVWLNSPVMAMGLVSCIGGSENDENTLTNCGALGWPTSWLPKFKVVGDTDPEFCPWPLSDAVKGMAPGVAVLTVNVPLRSPGAVGLNATCI